MLDFPNGLNLITKALQAEKFPALWSEGNMTRRTVFRRDAMLWLGR